MAITASPGELSLCFVSRDSIPLRSSPCLVLFLSPEGLLDVCFEDLDDVAHLEQDLVADFQPANSQARFALSQQALVRLARGPDLRTRSISRPALKLTSTPNATGHFPAE